jgi:hypothetical protein
MHGVCSGGEGIYAEENHLDVSASFVSVPNRIYFDLPTGHGYKTKNYEHRTWTERISTARFSGFFSFLGLHLLLYCVYALHSAIVYSDERPCKLFLTISWMPASLSPSLSLSLSTPFPAVYLGIFFSFDISKYYNGFFFTKERMLSSERTQKPTATYGVIRGRSM